MGWGLEGPALGVIGNKWNRGRASGVLGAQKGVVGDVEPVGA